MLVILAGIPVSAPGKAVSLIIPALRPLTAQPSAHPFFRSCSGSDTPRYHQIAHKIVSRPPHSILGQAASLKGVEITFSGLEGKGFEGVYYSEEDEYAGQIRNAIQNGSVEKDAVVKKRGYFYIHVLSRIGDSEGIRTI